MSVVLSTARSEVARRAQEFLASAVSTPDSTGATLIDANGLWHVDGYWDETWVRSTSGANSGVVRRVKTFVSSTATLTLYSAFAGAIASGMTYELYRRFPPTDVDLAINRAINVGAPDFREKVRAVATATMNQLEYPFPLGPEMMDKGLVNIEYQYYTDSTQADWPFQKVSTDLYEVLELSMPPLAAPTVLDGGVGGTLSNIPYVYAISYVRNGGESAISSETTYTPSSSAHLAAIAITAGATGTSARKIYRRTTVAGATLTLIKTISDNTTLIYNDDGTSVGGSAPDGNMLRRVLQLRFNPETNRLIRFIYDGPLGNVSADTDQIHLDLPELEWLYQQSVAELWRMEVSRTSDADRKSAVEELARHETRADKLRRQLAKEQAPRPLRRTSFRVIGG